MRISFAVLAAVAFPYTALVALEEELKFAVPSLEGIKAKLLGLGAKSTGESSLEDNWVLDDERHALRAGGCLLRVRQWKDRCTVTFKGPARFQGGVKGRQELELRVDDSRVALELFAALGYRLVFRYQKFREQLVLGEVQVAMDRTPMGDFLELEGPASAIRQLASRLGLPLKEALAGSYLDLWRQRREQHPDLPEDMVFPPGFSSP